MARGGRDMPMELIEWICRRLESDARQPFEELHMTGGEVTALKGFPAIVERLAATGLDLGVTTSGWCRAQGSWRELLHRIRFKKFYVSLDHADREANDAIRGPGSWHRAMRAVQEATAARDRLGYPEVNVISVVHRENIRVLKDLWQLLMRWGVDRWMPAHLEAAANYPALVPTQDDLEALARARARSPAFDQAIGDAFDPDHVPSSLIVTGLWPDDLAPKGCSTLGRLLLVHPNGNVYGCYGSEYSEVTLLEQVRGPDFPSFADMLAKATRSVPNTCRHCPEPVQQSNLLRSPDA